MLLKRKLPKIVIRLLFVWYRMQTFVVKWENILSDTFNVGNGVRQGGVLSPHLFNIFIEGLSDMLKSVNIGCFMNGICFNHLFYADDAILLAPTPEALQMLIDICSKFAACNEMQYNVTKSCCMAFIPAQYGNINVPKVFLENHCLSWKAQKKYLGYVLNSKYSDDDDIQRQMASLYTRGNMLNRNFSHCSHDVKLQLFKTYFYSIYMSSVWCNFSKSTKSRVRVAYNNCYRAFMNVSRRESISGQYVSNGVNTFIILDRKYMYSSLKRIMESSNILINTVVSSTYFVHKSRIFNEWNDKLFVY